MVDAVPCNILTLAKFIKPLRNWHTHLFHLGAHFFVLRKVLCCPEAIDSILCEKSFMVVCVKQEKKSRSPYRGVPPRSLISARSLMNCYMSPCRSDYILACYASPLYFGHACSLLYSVHADKSASLSIVVTGSIMITCFRMFVYHYCFPRYCLLREFHR
jgi:hypothetical protein